MSREELKEAKVGDNVGIGLSISKESVERGQILIATNSVPIKKQVTTNMYFLTKAEAGLSESINSTDKETRVYLFTNDFEFEVLLDNSNIKIEAGKKHSGLITLNTSMPVESGYMFMVRMGGRTIGTGIINEVKD